MKEITKYWKQTCIDFGKYVQQQWARHEDADMLWLEFQEQKAAIKQNEMIRQKLEDAEEEGFDDDLMETLPEIKCYCGHTTTCDCEPETKQ